MWGPPEGMVEKYGFDVEKVVWDEIVWTACGLEGYVFRDWEERGDVCGEVRKVHVRLFGEG